MIIVTGADGMLGRYVVREARARARMAKVAALTHRDIDISDPVSVLVALDRVGASTEDVIINCAGVKPPGDPLTMIAANGVGPNVLATIARKSGTRVVQVSTDCVFSGAWAMLSPRAHRVEENPDPIDLYGRSKLLGEVYDLHVLIVRTSFVGPESGLWKWLADQPKDAAIETWLNAFWSGSTVDAVAKQLVSIATGSWPAQRIVHLAAPQPISKHRALELLRAKINRPDIVFWPTARRVDRGLLATHLLPTFEDALASFRRVS